MQTIRLADVKIGERQRKEFKPKPIEDLQKSILSKGLLHPIVLTSTYALVAGERRARAVKALIDAGMVFQHNGQPVPLGEIPFVFISDLSPVDLLEAELDENLHRVDLSWQEKAQAIANIHKLRVMQNPAQSYSDTARELQAVDPSTDLSLSGQAGIISKSILLAENMDDPEVANAPNPYTAVNRLLAKTEQALRSKLQTISTAPVASRHSLEKGDLFELMSRIPDKSVDVIICDPPYGIQADTSGASIPHQYNDSVDNALGIAKHIFLEGFRVTKPKAVLWMFCDVKMFGTLHKMCHAALWTPWNAAIIWAKGPGAAPWGQAGFQRSYEAILFAVKGRRELVSPGGSDVLIDIDRVNRGTKSHAAEKPVALYQHLLRLSAYPGDVVLDPCCGSGTVFAAAEQLNLRAIGFELNDTYHKLAAARLQQLSEPSSLELPPNA